MDHPSSIDNQLYMRFTAHRYAIWFLERAERWYLCWNWHINSWPIISCLLTVNRWIGMWLWQVRTESMADESSISGMAPPKKERCSGSFHLQLSSWISKIVSWLSSFQSSLVLFGGVPTSISSSIPSREVSILWSYLDITLLFSSYVYLIFCWDISRESSVSKRQISYQHSNIQLKRSRNSFIPNKQESRT